MAHRTDSENEIWPALPFEAWKETCATLHLWTQIAGKIRLQQMPPINHCWQVTLYVTARGLTTGPMPHGTRTFQLDFDFLDHNFIIETASGEVRTIALHPMPVAEFYGKVMKALNELDLSVDIVTMPNEFPDPIAFEKDETHATYDAEYARRFWRVLAQTERVFQEFRAHFIGKCSPVHFFWGSADLAVTRFSGRGAPEHPGGVPGLPDAVTRRAYSHELSSAGFWPGGGGYDDAAFYSYAYPEPDGFKTAAVRPDDAFYHEKLREFVLPYAAMRQAPEPDRALMEFLQSTYEAAANCGDWDRKALEK
jgi:hypothetical protein